jgi:hypothetical protein
MCKLTGTHLGRMNRSDLTPPLIRTAAGPFAGGFPLTSSVPVPTSPAPYRRGVALSRGPKPGAG